MTADAVENVAVEPVGVHGRGDIDWTNDVVAGSVRLFLDTSSNGLYNPSTTTLLVSGQAFDSAGAVTFSNINGLTLLSSAPQTLLLVFNLNMAGLTDRTFNNAIDSASIVAVGADDG